MKITDADVIEILTAGTQFNPRVRVEVGKKWLKRAGIEISGGHTIKFSPDSTPKEDSEFIAYYLQILRVADMFFTAIDGKGISEHDFLATAKKAFEYCEIDNARTGNAAVHAARHLTTNFYHQVEISSGGLIKLTSKGKRSLDKVFGDSSFPDVEATIKAIEATDEAKEEGDNIASSLTLRQRVSKTFLDAMKKVVLSLSRKKHSNMTGVVIYAEMQKICPALTQTFNASDLAHGKKTLSLPPHNLKFEPRKYRLLPESIPQVGEITKESKTGKRKKSR